MRYLGDYAASSTLYFTFSTHKADGTPATLSGSPSLAIYKADGVGQSTTGITLVADFDSVTGLNSVKVVCSDAFYAVANDYSVVIAAGTVDSVSVVGYTVATFSIENRKSAGYGAQLTTIDGIVDDILTDTGTTIPGTITTLQGNVTDILTDTGTTLDTLIKDIPTVSEFEARTIVSANYALDSTVAKAATALSNAVWTDAKAGYLTGNVALEATLTAIKGAGWTTETLAAIDALIDTLKATVDNIHDTDLPAVKAETASIQSDTNDIQGRLPAALVDGKISADASVSLSAGDIEGIADAVIAGIAGGGSTLYTDTVTSGGVLQVGAKIAIYHAITDADPFTVVYTDSTGTFKAYLDAGTYPVIVTSEGDVQKITSITVT